MTTLFTACALFGGTLLLCQTFLTLIGLSGDHTFDGDTHGEISAGDCDHGGEMSAHGHHSSTWYFGIITFRTMVAALTFFGMAGMAAHTSQMADGPSLVIALLAGFAAMYTVHWLMKQLGRLRADGSLRIEGAVGMTGNVYLRVPGAHQGAGKIVLNLQNRTVELTAWTNQTDLATGVPVVVTKVVGPDSVEVVAAPLG